VKILVILFILLFPASALSESLTISGGQINAWHDGGPVKDRASGTGTIEYAWEGYEGGGSSGFNVSDGKATYFFGAEDYSIELRDFEGSIIAESDTSNTTIDGAGSGTMKTKSYDGSKMGILVAGMPSGEMNAKGIWEIHAISSARQVVGNTSLMDDNITEGDPVAFQINSSTEFIL
jgi:hypothetical protein